MDITRQYVKQWLKESKLAPSGITPLIRTALTDKNCWDNHIEVQDDPDNPKLHYLKAVFHPDEEDTLLTDRIVETLTHSTRIEKVGTFSKIDPEDNTGTIYELQFWTK